MNENLSMGESPSLLRLFIRWYVSRNTVAKVVYPVLWVLLYLASVLAIVGAYWLKTDLNYNVFTHGGWHTFARCVKTGLDL